MEIIERKVAKAQGLTKYFTGKECKNGHLSYRYVQSGTCEICVNGDRAGVNDPCRDERRQAKLKLQQQKFRLFHTDREQFAASAWAFAVLRYPCLLEIDIDPRLIATGREPSGTGMYTFYGHPDDAAALFDLSNALINAKPKQIHADSAKRLQAALSAAEDAPGSEAPPESRDGFYN